MEEDTKSLHLQHYVFIHTKSTSMLSESRHYKFLQKYRSTVHSLIVVQNAANLVIS